MNLPGLTAVIAGAACGAVLRWVLAESFNQLHPRIAVGTLMANLLGGLLIGLVMFHVDRNPEWSPMVRLGVVTGMLGSLTTFSTFSHETIQLVHERHYAWASVTVAVHVVGSLAATAAGILTARSLS